MLQKVFALYEGYVGTGMMAGLFLVALLYLFLKEKNKTARIMFIYMPLAVLVLYFCPLFAKIVYTFVGEEIYYRTLWLVPMVPVLAYGAVSVVINCEEKKRVAVCAALCGIVILSGSMVYKSPYFSRAENSYHVPETVVEICEAIEIEGREVKAVFPKELLQYVRQYTPYVYMPYGREVLVDRWGWWSRPELYLLMEEEVLSADKIAEEARKNGCHYLIFSEEKEVEGSFEKQGYRLFDTIDNYRIYEDTTLYKGL